MSNNTISKALQNLESQGLIKNFRTSSYMVLNDSSQIRKNVIVKETMSFLENMQELGFSNEEILTLAIEYMDRFNHKKGKET